MGIQFNSSSNGRGSKIDNASIIHSTYGITVYGSDPYLANVTIWNPDDVGVDLFNSATPTIRNLVLMKQAKIGISLILEIWNWFVHRCRFSTQYRWSIRK